MVKSSCAVEEQDLTSLRPYARNARTHSRKQIRQIAASIERFGFTNPVLVSDDGEIIAGHGRVEAAKLLGRKTVLADAFEAQKLVLAAPDLTINQLANKAGRCRKQLHKLFRLSWLSPQIVDAIVSGAQPKSITRRRLLECELPIDWSEQEELLGI